ncbi:MAG TPA: hypothetical protein VK563_18700 [Puia sp.]|nr:hypothetical protein [Puia sp.]
MNTENLEFLQESLKYLGFGEKLLLNQQLEELIAKQPKDFVLETEAFYDEETRLETTLHFRRSEQLDMYFFNRYEAKLCFGGDPARDRGHTFYINKGSGVTLREAYNLLQGRAVNKDLTDSEGQKYNAWIQLNLDERDGNNNYKMKQFRLQYGYNLEKTLEKYPIRELKNEILKTSLIKSLKKGNLHTVSFEKPNKIEKMLIEANPQYKTINIYSFGNRSGGKASPKQDQGTAGVNDPRPGSKNPPEEKEEDPEDREEMKEEEMELPGGKPPTKKRSYR